MPPCTIPFDVWSIIAEYLPPDMLPSLSQVNHAFYEIAQRVKYQVTDLVTYDKNTKRLLTELKNPSLGSLVRTVHIQPWKVSDLAKPSPRRRCRVLDTVRSLVNADYAMERSKAAVEKRLRKHTRLVLDTVSRLHRVIEYRIEWDETPSYHAEFFRAFLCPLLADTSFGHGLVKFSLKVPVERLPYLAAVHLPQLEELDVHLYTDNIPSQEVDYCLDSFAVFVNNLYGTLRSLAVTSTRSSKNLNLNHLFHLLGYFPHLRSFALSTPCNGVHVWPQHGANAPFPLQIFIDKHHRQLQELKLMCSSIGTVQVPDPEAKDWIRRILDHVDERYRLLSRLEVDIRNLRGTDSELNDFLASLGNIVNQLDSLVLTECPLRKVDVERLINLFAQSTGQADLRMLALRVQCLSPEVMDLLAYGLPLLQRLELTFTEVKGAQFGNRSEQLSAFLARMSGRRYVDWQLLRLALSESPFNDVEWVDSMEPVLVESIPSLHHVNPLPALSLYA
ncbi:hypothetical protein K435DRAFT_837877 [Dendrothele bispora CBS 962.96]|uniref:F-box domain-containing protein n=1 Tax=Dendrothele bispora (strain CBS 962.96) TaxID=1314807 RepID=A0A4S8MAP8_DENBC|nr:hypothetical protein K435DRAFT_837877 [Dendrothele bispora CBS 962.96]